MPPPLSLNEPPKLFPGMATPQPAFESSNPLQSRPAGVPLMVTAVLSLSGHEGAVCSDMTFEPETVVFAGTEALAARMEPLGRSPRARRVSMEELEFALAPSITSISPPLGQSVVVVVHAAGHWEEMVSH